MNKMKIGIYANPKEESQRVFLQLKMRLEEENFELDDVSPDIVITIGGDGTVLNAVHHYEKRLEALKFMGIHTGHLGYYTDWLPHEIEELITFLKQSEFQVVSYPLLEIIVQEPNNSTAYVAFNEMTILNSFRTQHLNVMINELFFESFRGTGICISTPTGSTAYNKSLGGAIVYPDLEVLQLTEIGSINNNVYRTIGSPLIIPKKYTVHLTSESFNGITLTRDHLYETFDKVEKIEVNLSDRQVSFVRRDNQTFWHRVKQHFL